MLLSKLLLFVSMDSHVCASDEACGVGGVTLFGGLKRAKAAEGADMADAAIVTSNCR